MAYSREQKQCETRGPHRTREHKLVSTSTWLNEVNVLDLRFAGPVPAGPHIGVSPGEVRTTTLAVPQLQCHYGQQTEATPQISHQSISLTSGELLES